MSNTYKDKRHGKWKRASIIAQKGYPYRYTDVVSVQCHNQYEREVQLKMGLTPQEVEHMWLNWSNGCPKWWNKLFHIRPRRQKERVGCRKITFLGDYEDSPEFPLSKKPHSYYW